MRLARISFTRMLMMHTGGLPNNLFLDMMKALPPDAKIVGFGEDHSWGTCHIFVTSERFKDTPDGTRPHEISANFRRTHVDGQSFDVFEQLNMTEAMDQNLGCFHEWKEYHGAMHRYDYCTKCNVKKENA